MSNDEVSTRRKPPLHEAARDGHLRTSKSDISCGESRVPFRRSPTTRRAGPASRPGAPRFVVLACLALALRGCGTVPTVWRDAAVSAGSLPAAAFDGTSRITLDVGGAALALAPPGDPRLQSSPLPVPALAAVAGGDALRGTRALAPGVDLVFWRQGSDAEETGHGILAIERARSLGARPLSLEVEIFPRRFDGPVVYCRRGSEPERDTVFATYGEWGGRLADSAVDADSGWSLELSRLDDAVSWAPVIGEAGRRGFRVRAVVRAPGRTLLFAWSSTHEPRAESWRLVRGGAAAARRGSSVLVRGGSAEGLAAVTSVWGRGVLPPDLIAVELGKGPRRGRAADPGSTAPADDEETDEIVWASLPAAGGSAKDGPTLATPSLTVYADPFSFAGGRDGALAPGAAIVDSEGRFVASGANRIAAGEEPLGYWDPTRPAGRERIRAAVATVAAPYAGSAGALRLGGIAGALEVYRAYASRLDPAGTRGRELEQPSRVARAALASALAAVREAAGEVLGAHCRLLGDWDTPVAAAGLLDGALPVRQAGDGGDLLRREAGAAQRESGVHGLVWHCDGFLFEIGPAGHPGGLEDPAPFRTLVDLKAISGRSFAFDASEWRTPHSARLFARRRALLERALPAAPVRALDLDAGARAALASTWTLQVAIPGRPPHDVIGFFNWNSFGWQVTSLPLARLELPREHDDGGAPRYLVFDVHAERFLGSVGGDGAVTLSLPPRGSRLLSLHAFPERPAFVGSSAELIAGDRLVRYERWDPVAGHLELGLELPAAGRSDDENPLRLHLAVPPARWRSVAVTSSACAAVDFERSGVHQTVRVSGRCAGEVRLDLTFAPARGAPAVEALEVADPPAPRLTADPATGGALLEWEAAASGVGDLVGGYAVFRDGEPLATLADGPFLDTTAAVVEGTPRYGVSVVRPGAGARPPGESSPFERPRARSAFLSDLAPVAIGSAWGYPGKDMSVEGRRLPEKGLGVAVPARIEYVLAARFAVFHAEVSVDRAADLWTRLVFEVRVDGEPRYRSPEVRYGDRPLPLEVDLRGARRLLLSVASATGEASPRAMAIWERARLVAAE